MPANARTALLTLLVLTCLILSGCQASNRNDTPIPIPASTPAEPVAPQEPASAGNGSTTVQPAAPAPNVGGGKYYSWWFTRNSTHQVPAISPDISKLLATYHGFYVLPNDHKKIYLTFDCGYELGYAPRILDILARQQVKAAFFITGHYLNTQPDLVRRMQEAGHLVASHTYSHPDLPTISHEKFIKELTSLEDKYNNVTGAKLAPYLRPPNGSYSAATLSWAQEAGYSTVFWSMALVDWDPNQQPGAAFVHQHILNNIHPGAVILLHVVSQSDTEALEQIITDLKQQGYKFGTF